MGVLHNRVSQKELKALMLLEKEPRVTISFYRYFSLPDPQAFRDELYLRLSQLSVFGRIYVATEGINAQVSVPEKNFDSLRDYLDSIPQFSDLRVNRALDDDGKSFWVLKIKVKEKIVADGIVDPEFSMYKKGSYVNAEQFNELANDPDTIIVDMRNHYEYEVGHFKNALEVPSDTFRDQLPMSAEMLQEAREKNIIMYCTGGIRCEKASAYLLHRGFNHVFHLEGGIINYVNTVRQKGLENKFTGKNFVFDERLGEKITDDVIAVCHQCGHPADTHTNCRNEGCHTLFIQCEACAEKYSGCCSTECQDIYLLPGEEQKLLRKGNRKDAAIFSKSRQRRAGKPPHEKNDAIVT